MHPKMLIKRLRSRKTLQNHHRKTLDESISRITLTSESEASNHDDQMATEPQNESNDPSTSLQSMMIISDGTKVFRRSRHNEISFKKYRYNLGTRKMRRRNAINFLATEQTSDTLATSMLSFLLHSTENKIDF